jgi:hypothetical protein
MRVIYILQVAQIDKATGTNSGPSLEWPADGFDRYVPSVHHCHGQSHDTARFKVTGEEESHA